MVSQVIADADEKYHEDLARGGVSQAEASSGTKAAFEPWRSRTEPAARWRPGPKACVRAVSCRPSSPGGSCIGALEAAWYHPDGRRKQSSRQLGPAAGVLRNEFPTWTPSGGRGPKPLRCHGHGQVRYFFEVQKAANGVMLFL